MRMSKRPVGVVVIVLLVLLGAAVYLARGAWLPTVAASLVCDPGEAHGDAILVDFVEHNYSLFQRAQQLQSADATRLLLVPVLTTDDDEATSRVATGVADVMCRVAQATPCTSFPVRVIEPISLNLAHRAAEELGKRGVRSVLLVTSAFRSRRSAAIFGKVMEPRGIKVHCQPVYGQRTPENWYRTWHGVQDVVLQAVKLAYYRLAVLPGM